MRPGSTECIAPTARILQRTTAYIATLSSNPDNTAETGVGPSAWASGNQLCNGARPTFTYTKDLAHAIERLVRTDAYGLYHITSGGQCSWYEFAARIFELLGLTPDFGPATTAAYGLRAMRPAYSALAHHNLKQRGFDDLRPWPEALAAYLKEKGHK